MERCTRAPFSKEEMFHLNLQEWSPIKIGEKGALAFYFVQEKGSCQTLPMESALQGHQNLSADAKRDMMGQLINTIKGKKAIDLSWKRVEEESL